MVETWIERQSAKEKIILEYNIEFQIGQIVYLKTDNQQKDRMIIGIHLKPNANVVYVLACGSDESYHYGIEIDDVRDVVKATNR